jgi:hypothetical protein
MEMVAVRAPVSAPQPVIPTPPPVAALAPPPAPAPVRRVSYVIYGAAATFLAAAVAFGAWQLVVALRARPEPAPSIAATHVVVDPPPTPPAPAPKAVAASVTAAPPEPPPGPCPPGMLLFEKGCIDEHEAPQVGVTLDEARAACAKAEKRLCKGEEWEAACRGTKRASYPYGWSYKPSCNTRGAEIVKPGSFPDCVSASGARDMSGNAAEWVEEGTLRGGSALDGGDGRCSRPRRPGAALADAGYRCCAEARTR